MRLFSVSGEFQASPWNRWLAVTSRRIEFVILQTASSSPIALHLASQQRSYLRLQGLAYPDTDLHRAVCTPSRTHDPRLHGDDGVFIGKPHIQDCQSNKIEFLLLYRP